MEEKRSRLVLWLALSLCLFFAWPAKAQNLRFDNHRKVQIPEYAVLRIGPFYSNLALSQSVGYRWTRSRGSGTDYTFANHRGVIKADGSEIPIITALDIRNYILLSEHTDLDLSVRARNEYYPLDTQEDDFYVTLPDEGIDGTLSSSFRLTPFVRGTLSDNFVYRTDYVDTRGMEDVFGGSRYEYFRNTAKMDMDWLMARDKNLGIGLSRDDNVPIDDEFDAQKRVTYREGISYGQRLLPGLIAGGRAGFSQTEYAETNIPNANTEDYSLFLRGAKSDRVTLTELTTLSVGFGFSGARSQSERSASQSRTENDVGSASGYAELMTRLAKNLSHTLSYRRSINTGFKSNFVLKDAYRYQLNWQRDLTTARVYTGYSDNKPSSSLENDYSSWDSGIEMKIPITRAISALASSVYSVRRNKGVTIVPSEDDPRSAQEIEEQDNDYNTWESRLGSSFQLTKQIDFSTYAQHVERSSGSSNLEYTRDTVSALLTYRHVF